MVIFYIYAICLIFCFDVSAALSLCNLGDSCLGCLTIERTCLGFLWNRRHSHSSAFDVFSPHRFHFKQSQSQHKGKGKVLLKIAPISWGSWNLCVESCVRKLEKRRDHLPRVFQKALQKCRVKEGLRGSSTKWTLREPDSLCCCSH